MVHHRVHVSAGDAEEETWPAAGGEVGEAARFVPARLAHDADPEPARGEQAADQRNPEGRVIDVRVAVDQDDVELIPSAPPGVVEGHRQIRPGAGPRGPFCACGDLDEALHRSFITSLPV